MLVGFLKLHRVLLGRMFGCIESDRGVGNEAFLETRFRFSLPRGPGGLLCPNAILISDYSTEPLKRQRLFLSFCSRFVHRFDISSATLLKQKLT